MEITSRIPRNTSFLSQKNSTNRNLYFHSLKGKPEFTHITKFPHSVIQRPVGSTVRLKCEGKGHPRPQLTWLRDGHPVMTGGSAYRGAKPLSTSYHLPSGAKLGRWTLQMQDLQPQDAGNYTCLLHNIMGSKNITFNIEVVGKFKRKCG